MEFRCSQRLTVLRRCLEPAADGSRGLGAAQQSIHLSKSMTSRIPIPPKLDFLFWETQPNGKPARWKVAHGGRDGAKSWSFARALLMQGAAEPLRILCAREVQRSLQESVHHLLADQIGRLNLHDFY